MPIARGKSTRCMAPYYNLTIKVMFTATFRATVMVTVPSTLFNSIYSFIHYSIIHKHTTITHYTIIILNRSLFIHS